MRDLLNVKLRSKFVCKYDECRMGLYAPSAVNWVLESASSYVAST